MQQASSIGDQERVCREFAKEQGWVIVDVFEDAAVRAGAMAKRAGWSQLLAAGARGEFDVVLVEELSRFSRDFKQSWAVLADLENVSVRLADTKSGQVDLDTYEGQVLASLRFAGNQMETRRLGERSKRGQRGALDKKYSAGGRPAYGLMRKPIFSATEVDEDGRPKKLGVPWVPHTSQSHIVRRIFQMYDDGWTKGGLAKQLNSEGVSTRDKGKKKTTNGVTRVNPGTWTASGIKAILENRIYIGEKTWNESSRKGKPLESGKKRLRKNDPEQVIVIRDFCEPLIGQELWDRCEARRTTDAEEYQRKRTARKRQKYLLSGLIRCASCGYSFVIGTRNGTKDLHYRCGYRASRGKDSCNNKTNVSQPGIEKRVKGVIDSIVKDPTHLEALVAEHNRSIQSTNNAQLVVVESLMSELQGLESRRSNYVDAVGAASSAGIPVLVERLELVELDIAKLKARLERAEGMVQPLLRPSLDAARDFVEGGVSIFSGDFHKDRQFIEQVISRISIFADGAVLIRFQENNLFTPIHGYRLGRERDEPLFEARKRHRFMYESNKRHLEEANRMPEDPELVVIEGSWGDRGHVPGYMFTEPGAVLPPINSGENDPGAPPGVEKPLLDTVGDPTGT